MEVHKSSSHVQMQAEEMLGIMLEKIIGHQYRKMIVVCDTVRQKNCMDNQH